MADLICKGCGETVDASGVDPFTVCECSSCGTELIVPFILNHLYLERYLETQSVIDIYEGFDNSSNMEVMINVLDSDASDYEFFEELVKEEATALGTLKHENITPIMSSGKFKGNYYITTPKMDGYSLESYNPGEQGM